MPKESFEKLQVDGAQIAYRRIGNGRPLMALNGFAATSADWDPSFLDTLASSNEVVLLDNRGIGRSTDNGRPFDIAQLADDATRVLEALGIERTSLLGWSMGGFIALTLALQHPGRIALVEQRPENGDERKNKQDRADRTRRRDLWFAITFSRGVPKLIRQFQSAQQTE